MVHRIVRRGRVLRAFYASCLLGATGVHLAALVRHGLFWDYGGVPAASAAFCTMLTVLDPAAALLLVVRPHAGVLMTIAIIAADVVHNLWMAARYAPALRAGILLQPQLLAQIAFLLFVAATARHAWRHDGAASK